MKKIRIMLSAIFILIFTYSGNYTFALSAVPAKDFSENVLGTYSDGIVLHNNLYVTATLNGVCVLNIKTNQKKTVYINEHTTSENRFVFYVGNSFILIYGNGSVYKSVDGYKWSKFSNIYESLKKPKDFQHPDGVVSDIKYFNNKFYIADCSESGKFIITSNLLQYKTIDFPEYNYMYFDKFFVSNGTIYISGGDYQNHETYYILSSKDGEDWSYDSEQPGFPTDIIKYNNHEYILACGDQFSQYNNLIIDGKAYSNKPLHESPGSFIEYKNKLCLIGDYGKIWSFSVKGNNILYSLVTTIKFNDDNMPFLGGGKITDEGLLCSSPTNVYMISKNGEIKSLSSDKSRPETINECFWDGSKCCFYNYDPYHHDPLNPAYSAYYETSDGKNFNLVKSPVKNLNQAISSKAGLLFKDDKGNLYFSNGKGVQDVALHSYGMSCSECKVVFMNPWHEGFIILEEYYRRDNRTNHLLIFTTKDGVTWNLNSDLQEEDHGFQQAICDGNSISIIRNDINKIAILNSKNLSSWSKSYIQDGNNVNNSISGAGKTKEGYFIITGDMKIFKSADGVKWTKIILPDEIAKSDSNIYVTNCSFCYDGYIFEVSKYINKKPVDDVWVYRNGSFSKLQLPEVNASDTYKKCISIKGNFYILYSNVLYLVK